MAMLWYPIAINAITIQPRGANKMIRLSKITLLEKLLIGTAIIAALTLLVNFYIAVTYVNPCDKICDPGVTIKNLETVCICANNIEVKEIK